MNELDEVIMVGSAENDYPNGDFVCLCYGCGVDFHGPPVTMCYRCQNEKEPVPFAVNLSLLLLSSAVMVMAFLGALFL